jgi:hypothetical protein
MKEINMHKLTKREQENLCYVCVTATMKGFNGAEIK